MQTSNYWQLFEKTGRVQDYLSYREKCRQTQEQGDDEITEKLEASQKETRSECTCRNSFT